MTITERQRRILDIVADGLGWNWSDVETMAELMFGECVAGLTEYQAARLLDAMADEAYPRESRAHG